MKGLIYYYLLRLIGGVTHPRMAGSLTVGCAPSKAQCVENRGGRCHAASGALSDFPSGVEEATCGQSARVLCEREDVVDAAPPQGTSVNPAVSPTLYRLPMEARVVLLATQFLH
tara:strand:+ start:15161 stop:15502 length:342 start_codon:yes stop_codon:yes gene_type:complete